MGELGTISSFQVTHVFQGKLYKMNVIYLKCLKVLTKLCLFMDVPFTVLIFDDPSPLSPSFART